MSRQQFTFQSFIALGFYLLSDKLSMSSFFCDFSVSSKTLKSSETIVSSGYIAHTQCEHNNKGTILLYNKCELFSQYCTFVYTEEWDCWRGLKWNRLFFFSFRTTLSPDLTAEVRGVMINLSSKLSNLRRSLLYLHQTPGEWQNYTCVWSAPTRFVTIIIMPFF